jgi:putative ATP-dependent endonuclease of OLD family
MYISRVSLRNYRNFSNSSFLFNKGINTIIGENGSGKTNLFKAIRLLLEDSSYQFAYKLDESDFNRSIGDWRGHWIIISIEFDEISQDESIQSLFVHGVGKIEQEIYVKKATYNLYFRPKADIRLKLSELKEGDKEGLEAILNSINIKENYETFFAGKSTVDFNDDNVYKELVGDFNLVKFKFEIDSSKFGIKIPHQLSVANEISFTFIKALRDVVSDFHNNRTNPLLTLLKSKSGDIKKEDYDPISALVNNLNTGIENLPDVQNIRNDIKDTIKDAVGATYSPSSLSIKSSLSDEADKLLQSLKIFIGEPGESHEGGIHELSLGGANLIFLTLKLLEYKYQKSKEKFACFLIIEEPEAHIHTHIQKTLFDKLDYSDTQIIYSTHSTHISEVSNVKNINILAKNENNAEVFQPSIGLADNNINEIQRYLDAIRTNLLFAKGVILVEGDAEEIVIPIMVKRIFGVTLDELGISIINIRSTGFENLAQLFHDLRIRRKCSIITDLDTAICDTTINAGDKDKVIAYKTSALNSQISGLERRKRISKFIDKNKWINVFYAKHTFEVDFIMNNNAWEIIQLLDKCYSAEFIEKAKSQLESSDVSIYGRRALLMANQQGKGWFAIMLCNYITEKTNIPDYIINAITFAKGVFSSDLIVDIIKFRIDKLYNLDDKLDFTIVNIKLAEYQKNNIQLDGLIKVLEEIIPNDQLITLLKSI